MPYFVADPVYRRTFRDHARTWRAICGVHDQMYFPIVEFMERDMYAVAKTCDIPYLFDISEDRELKGLEGETDLANGIVRVSEEVYLKACDNDGRARMTLAHELGHYLYHREIPVKLARSLTSEKPPPFRDPEWQASCFGGELLMAAHLIRGTTPLEVSEKCCVTLSAAKYQLSKI